MVRPCCKAILLNMSSSIFCQGQNSAICQAFELFWLLKSCREKPTNTQEAELHGKPRQAETYFVPKALTVQSVQQPKTLNTLFYIPGSSNSSRAPPNPDPILNATLLSQSTLKPKPQLSLNVSEPTTPTIAFRFGAGFRV